MKTTERVLLRRAAEAARRAYAPYSGFRVGAAVETADGRVFTGCNVENASYGLTVCAERVAIGGAVAAGARRFRRIAVVSRGPRPAYPCGACLQVIAEFCGPDTEILMAGSRGARELEKARLRDLLPHAFTL